MIELADLKDALEIPAANTDHDDYLTSLEGAAVAYVQRATGWYIGAEDAAAEFVVEGTGTDVLWLPERMSTVASVSSRAYEGGDETAIATGDDDGWALRTRPGGTHGMRLVRKGGSVWTAGTEYVVTGTIGYAAGSEPAMDREDVTALVTHWFENRLPVVTGTIASNVPLHVSQRLASRRRQRA